MRIRTIKPEFFLHEKLFEAEKESKLPLRVAFIGLWCACDREGRFRWEPRRLGIQILPWDNVDFSRVLDALGTRGFVKKYACETRDFGWIPSFSRHQVINNRESESELPDPLSCKESDAWGTRGARVGHAGKGEGKGREGEGNGKEGEGSGVETPEPPISKAKAPMVEIVAFCLEIGLPESDGEAMFWKWEANGWQNDKKPIKDWKSVIRHWKASGYLPSQKQPRLQFGNRQPAPNRLPNGEVSNEAHERGF